MNLSVSGVIRKARNGFKALGAITKSQKGFTLIELLIAIAITGAITGGVTMSIFQTLDYSSRNKARMEAVKQVENAIHWLSRDAQMAQELELAAEPDPDGFPLTLSWVEWEGDQITVTYSIVDGEMIRSHSGDGDLVVARHINSDEDMTNCDYENWVFNFRITATIGGYPEEVSETRDGKISPRPA